MGPTPFRTSPRNVGGERFFYADPDESPVEAALAVREGVIAHLVDEVRSTKQIPTDSLPVLCELFGQMVARTKNIREGLVTAGETTLTDFFGLASDSQKFRTEVRERAKNELAAKGVELPEHLVDRLLAQGLEQVFQEFQQRGGVTRLLHDLDLPAITQKAQVSALLERATTIGDRFSLLQWKVLTATEGSMILGDVGAVALRRRKKGGKPGVMFSPDHDLIVLPISDSVAIVGGTGDFSTAEVGVDRLNSSTAKLSREFFVSRTNKPREHSLQRVLGADLDHWTAEPRRQYKKKLRKLKKR